MDDISRIAGNTGAMNAMNNMNQVSNELATSQGHLATGKRINEAAEDPAGLIMGLSFNARSEALKTVINSVGNGQNLLAVAEGGLQSVTNILRTMRSTQLEASGDTVSEEGRAAIDAQLQQMAQELGDVLEQTTWNGQELLGGVELDMLSGADGELTAVNLKDLPNVNAVINGDFTKMEEALDEARSRLQDVGSYRERFRMKEDALSATLLQNESAYNRIMNADMASEMVTATKNQILQQTSTAMMGQANMAPQVMLKLFGI